MAQPTSFIFQHNSVSQLNPINFVSGTMGVNTYGRKLTKLAKFATVIFWYFKKKWLQFGRKQFVLDYCESRRYFQYARLFTFFKATQTKLRRIKK
jgi:hypothetical protein